MRRHICDSTASYEFNQIDCVHENRIGEAQTDFQHNIISSDWLSRRRLLYHSPRLLYRQWRGLHQLLQGKGETTYKAGKGNSKFHERIAPALPRERWGHLKSWERIPSSTKHSCKYLTTGRSSIVWRNSWSSLHIWFLTCRTFPVAVCLGAPDPAWKSLFCTSEYNLFCTSEYNL